MCEPANCCSSDEAEAWSEPCCQLGWAVHTLSICTMLGCLPACSLAASPLCRAPRQQLLCAAAACSRSAPWLASTTVLCSMHTTACSSRRVTLTQIMCTDGWPECSPHLLPCWAAPGQPAADPGSSGQGVCQSHPHPEPEAHSCLPRLSTSRWSPMLKIRPLAIA